jgi:hypothetical protein
MHAEMIKRMHMKEQQKKKEQDAEDKVRAGRE